MCADWHIDCIVCNEGLGFWALKVKMDLRPREEVDNDDDDGDGDDDDDNNYRCLGNRIRHMAALKYTKFSISIIEIPLLQKSHSRSINGIRCFGERVIKIVHYEQFWISGTHD